MYIHKAKLLERATANVALHFCIEEFNIFEEWQEFRGGYLSPWGATLESKCDCDFQ